MKLKDIKSIYRFLKNTDIVELEFEGRDGKVRIKRGVGAEQAAPVVAAAPAEKAEKREKARANIKTVTAPMVGTFYLAPDPKLPPFIQLGGTVVKGQTVCIIEAMKIMNEVESEYSGKVAEVIVENGQPVEYGEPLFRIEV